MPNLLNSDDNSIFTQAFSTGGPHDFYHSMGGSTNATEAWKPVVDGIEFRLEHLSGIQGSKADVD